VRNTTLKLVDLALQINEQGDYQVFVDISPHINNISFDIFEGGWKKNKPVTDAFNFWYKGTLYKPDSEKQIFKKLESYLEKEI